MRGILSISREFFNRIGDKADVQNALNKIRNYISFSE
jgi:hypothetical protein